MAFLEAIDQTTVPFVSIAVAQQGANLILSFDSVAGVVYGVRARDQINGPAFIVTTATGTGQRLSVPVPIVGAARFYQLVQYP